VNNINNGNALYPDFVPGRPDLFRANYYNAGGLSAIDLEQDGLTSVLTFQAPVDPGVSNHMKLAIADASDGIYDSAVFIQAGSLVSNENPVADLSLSTESGAAPLVVGAIVEGEDPNGLPLTYTISWGDGSTSAGPLDQPSDESEKTTLVDHTYTVAGTYVVTLTVSNGELSGTSTEDLHVSGVNMPPLVTSHPQDQVVFEGDMFVFMASASGVPEPEVQWQESTDFGQTYVNIPGAMGTTYSAIATLPANGNMYQAVFTNSEGSTVTDAAVLTVTALDTTSPVPPVVGLAEDTGASSSDSITMVGTLILGDIEVGAYVEYSTDNGTVWSDNFSASEGPNTVQVRQTDTAGNVSDVASFDFTLDTTMPALNPAFSTTPPFLVGASGIAITVNATDSSGVAAESAGMVDTSVAGLKSAVCTATDIAGNTASVALHYTVGYNIVNVLPMPGAEIRRSGTFSVSFQLIDANGLIADQTANALASSIVVTLDGQPGVSVKYNKRANTFSAMLKPGKTVPGVYDASIFVVLDGNEVAKLTFPITLI
jgi:PKD repeat protein